MMKKLFCACFTALTMLFAMTGLSRAQLVLSFTDLYPQNAYGQDQYGKYVPFHAKLTSNGVEQQNFEVYYTMAGAPPSKNDYVAGEEANTGRYRAVATNGVAEFLLNGEMFPFQAVAYVTGSSVASNVVSKSMVALFVDEPSFDPPAPPRTTTKVAPNTAVKIVDNAGGAEIYYSTDGETTPLKSQFGKDPNIYKYDDAVGVPVPKDLTIRAIAYKNIGGNEGGSEMVRGKFEMDNKPQLQVSLNLESDEIWFTNQAAPVITVTAFNGATLGTGANDVALQLDFSIEGQKWTQIVTESGTPLNMDKAIAAAQDDYCSIRITVVKGNATSVVVNDISVMPEGLGFDIEVPGEPPAVPVFSPPGRGTDGKSGDTVLKGTTVTIDCATEGAEIYYNVNKDDAPTARYTKPYTVNSDCVIKALSRHNGKTSAIVEAVYVVTNDPDKVTHRPEKVEKPTFTVPAGEVEAGTDVELRCITPGAQIYYTVNGSTPTASSTLYENAITVNEALTIKAIAVKGELTSEVAEAAYTIKGDDPDDPDNPDDPTPETIATPEISYGSGELNAGTIVYIHCETPDAQIRYTVDGSTPTASSTLYTSAGITVNGPLTLKAIAFKGDLASEVAEATYTIKSGDVGEKIELYFSPASGSEVYEGQEVTINPSQIYITEIFYMMFGSEEEARATAWDQSAAQSFNTEMKPVLSQEENTIKAAFVRPGNTAIDQEFFYATYTVNERPSIEFTFNPASGSMVEDGTVITVSVNREEADIYYKQYADKAAADADQESFVFYGKMVEEDGMPVITEGKTYLRCGVFDLKTGAMAYFDASYTIGTPIKLTFDPASGSEVEDGTTVTVTADREVKIYYSLYADEAAADADEDFIFTANMVEEDGMPVITEGKTYLRCGVFDGKMQYFDASYTLLETIAVPTFSVKAGKVEKGTKVELACATEGASIYFTVDGANPTAKSIPYREAIEIDGPMTIKAIAIKGDLKSKVAEAAYTIKVANEDEELAGVVVYPNPNDGEFHIELPVAATVDVFMANGTLYRRLNLGAGVNTLNIERSGIYFLRIAGEGRVTIKRIIVR